MDEFRTFSEAMLFLRECRLFCAIRLLKPVLSFSGSVKSNRLAKTLRIDDLSDVVEDK